MPSTEDNPYHFECVTCGKVFFKRAQANDHAETFDHEVDVVED